MNFKDNEPNFKIELGKFDSFGYELDIFNLLVYICILVLILIILF